MASKTTERSTSIFMQTKVSDTEKRQMTWEDCRWISNLFNKSPLGGIDASVSDGKGTNGSISPSATILVLEALWASAADAAGDKSVPVLLDAGCSEGRALMHWASLVAWHQPASLATSLSLYGFDLPHYKPYKEIHQTAEKFAKKHLGREVRISCVFKDCLDIESLQEEFPELSKEIFVVYAFWTCWYVEDKLKLIQLVRAEPNIKAFAVYVSTRENSRFQEHKFTAEFVLAQLCTGSTCPAWTLFKRIPKCKFIASNETVTALIFKRSHRIQHIHAQKTRDVAEDTSMPVHSDGMEVIRPGVSQDKWLDMCCDCGGGGEG